MSFFLNFNVISRGVFRIVLSCLFISSAAFAQSGASSDSSTESQSAAAPTSFALPEITVLGDQDKTSTYDFAPTVSELSGEKLNQKRASTLGETLSQEVGVSSSFFGPNSSRPVIRGLGGERVRILQNGTGILDASAASEDHAVAIDPLVVDRVEIVRGPAALLYGPSAIGGVVNSITNRIPETFQKGLLGKAESRYTSVDQGGSGALGLDYGAFDRWATHLDLSSRNSGDYSIPGYARTAALRESDPLPADEESNEKVKNSFNKTWSGSLGTSWIHNNGFVGASYSRYGSEYGTVAEEDVSIHMKQSRYDFAAGYKNLGFLESIRFKNTYSDYQHQEMEGEEVGTTFKNRGDEARLELRHKAIGPVTGTFGLQANIFKFEALGEEAFLPVTENKILSAFVYEEAKLGLWTPSLGLRIDNANVESLDSVNFGAGESHDFVGGSALVGLMYSLSKTNSLVLNLGHTERAPNYQELFANGAHVATGIYEVGDRGLGKEKAKSAELSFRHKGELVQGSIGGFIQQFDNFIALSPTGNDQTVDGDVFPEYAYRSVKAQLIGAEAEIRHQFPSLIPGGVLEVELKGDLVSGKNRDTDEYLPRITPARETLGLTYRASRYTLDTSVQHVEAQTKTAPNETSTPSYTLWNAGVEAPIEWNKLVFSLFGRVNNILDEEARSHVSVLKDIAPLPGRNVTVGLQALF